MNVIEIFNVHLPCATIHIFQQYSWPGENALLEMREYFIQDIPGSGRDEFENLKQFCSF